MGGVTEQRRAYYRSVARVHVCVFLEGPKDSDRGSEERMSRSFPSQPSASKRRKAEVAALLHRNQMPHVKKKKE